MESPLAGPGAVTVRASYDGIAGAAPVVRRLLARGDVVLALGPPGRPDLAALDVVARLALAARRGRVALVVRAPALDGLARLCGLVPVLGSAQPAGEPQPPEHLRAQEVVDVGDPPA